LRPPPPPLIAVSLLLSSFPIYSINNKHVYKILLVRDYMAPPPSQVPTTLPIPIKTYYYMSGILIPAAHVQYHWTIKAVYYRDLQRCRWRDGKIPVERKIREQIKCPAKNE
jgi:hypothetical protein